MQHNLPEVQAHQAVSIPKTSPTTRQAILICGNPHVLPVVPDATGLSTIPTRSSKLRIIGDNNPLFNEHHANSNRPTIRIRPFRNCQSKHNPGTTDTGSEADILSFISGVLSLLPCLVGGLSAGLSVGHM